VDKRLSFLIAIVFCFFGLSPAYALKVIEIPGFYIYYPKESGSLPQRLARWCPGMATFLKDQGLPLNKSVHIVLDADVDMPGTVVQLYPHMEIRIPMRAPGVLEDGYTEPDPWRYFLFQGLGLLAISIERSGLPAGAHHVFGEVISPNTILPDWITDGTSHLLYETYALHQVADPMAESIFAAGDIPNLDKVSNHPETWPGKFSYRIYGRPFIRWLYERYGWERLLLFLRLHGRGIIPLEIDLKAERAFGHSWSRLWQMFQSTHIPEAKVKYGIFIVGYWDRPYVYWNETGVYPGLPESGDRGRYGYMDQDNGLWLSEYVRGGISKLRRQDRRTGHTMRLEHIWDPGPGAVAVTRQGYRPVLIQFGAQGAAGFFDRLKKEDVTVQNRIPSPPGVLQMSGPVMDNHGRIAVACNSHGNWDIWLYDRTWYRLTDAPSVEMDPCWVDDKLVFASNAGGRFQIHGTDMRPLTHAAVGAILPRGTMCLELTGTGFQRVLIDTRRAPSLSSYGPSELPPQKTTAPPKAEEGHRYSVWKSIGSNYLAPDYFIDGQNLQLGISTKGLDVSKNYAWDAGVRYSVDENDMAWRLGYKAKAISTRATGYPFSYTTWRETRVDERRLDVKLAWLPVNLKALELSANLRRYDPEYPDQPTGELWWGNIRWNDTVGPLRALANLDLFNDDSQSLYGEIQYMTGRRPKTIVQIRAGKTWGGLNPGHNSFRIGGNTGEGFFTQRATRLFPLRGFDSNALDASQAASASLDLVMPVLKLQTGYKTLPFFLHDINLGGFLDTGFAADHFDADEILISSGIELITGMELAWDIMSKFSIRLAWPLKQPSDLDQSGPVILIQLGRPL
jgi:hypothetical protein